MTIYSLDVLLFLYYLEPVCSSMSSSNCCFLTCMQISQEADLYAKNSEKNYIQAVYFLSSVLEMFSGFGTPMQGQEKANIKKWDYINLKNHCIAKETFNKINHKLSKCEKTFVNYLSDKRLTANITQQQKSSKNPIKNGQRTWIGNFQRRHIGSQ